MIATTAVVTANLIRVGIIAACALGSFAVLSMAASF